MDIQLKAALLGGIVGVVGSLLSVAVGYYFQSLSAKGQIEHERKIVQDTFRRDNALRLIDMMMKDIEYYREALKEPNLPADANANIRKRIIEIYDKRKQLMRKEGLDVDQL